MATGTAVLVLFVAVLSLCCGSSAPELGPASRLHGNHEPELTVEQLEEHLGLGASQFDRRLESVVLDTTSRWQHHFASVEERKEAGGVPVSLRRPRRALPSLPDQLWHGFSFNTGVGNREELTLKGLSSGKSLSIQGPGLDAPPQWQVVSHRGIYYLFGLYPFAGTTKVHMIKTDFNDIFIQKTADFMASDLRVTPFLHFIRSTHAIQLFLFVKRSHRAVRLYAGQGHETDQIFCFLVDQDTLDTREACTPVSLAGEAGITGDILVSSLSNPYTEEEDVLLFPVQQSTALLVYRLQAIPYGDRFTLGVAQAPIRGGGGSVWRVRLFTAAGRSYVVIVYGDNPQYSVIEVHRYDYQQFTLVQNLTITNTVIDLEVFHIGFQHYMALAQFSRCSLYLWRESGFEVLHDRPSPLAYRWVVIPVKSCRHEVILAKIYSEDRQTTEVEFYKHNVRTGDFDEVHDVPCRNGARTGTGLKCFETPGDLIDLGGMVSVTTDMATYILLPSKLHELILVSVDASVGPAADPVWLENNQLQQRKTDIQSRYETLLAKLARIRAILDAAVTPGGDQTLSGDYQFTSVITADSLDTPDAVIDALHVRGYPGDVKALLAPLSELTLKLRQLEQATSRLDAILTDVVRKDDTDVNISGDKHFLSGMAVSEVTSDGGHVRVDRAHGVDVNRTLADIVTSNSERVITGRKTFTRGLVFTSNLDLGRLNGRPVSDIVTTDTIQEITGQLRFTGAPLEAEQMSVTGLVGGVDLNQLAFYDRSGRLPVHVSLQTLSSPLLHVSTVGGQSPEDLFSNVLQQEGGVFTEAVTFEAAHFLSNLTVTSTLNSVDIQSCLDSVLYTDQSHSLDALWLSAASISSDITVTSLNRQPFPGRRHVTVTSPAPVLTGRKFFDRLTVDHVEVAEVSGVRLSQLVTLDTEQTIEKLHTGPVLIVGNLTVQGTVDGVFVGPGFLDNLLTNSSQSLSVSFVFGGRVTLRGDVRATSVNGGDVSQLFSQLVTAQSGQTVVISAPKEFLNSVTTDVTLVNGTVNGVRTSDFLTLNTDQVVPGHVTFSSEVFFLSLHVSNTIDGVRFLQLVREAIYTNVEEQQLIVGRKLFSDAVEFDLLVIDGSINGIFVDTVLWTDTDQTVTGSHSYQGQTLIGGLHIHGDVIVPDDVTVAGYDFSTLMRRVEQTVLNGTHTDSFRFDRVIITGAISVDLLNSVDLTDIQARILLQEGGVVTAPWHFSSLCVNGSITSAAGSAGYHLSSLVSRVVRLSGGSVVTQPLTFNHLVVDGGSIDGQLILGGVSWETIVANLAQQHSTLTINVLKRFTKGITVIGGGLVSTNVTVTNLLTISTNQIVTGTVYFHANLVVHGDVFLTGLVNHRFNISQIQRTFVTQRDDVFIDGGLMIWGPDTIHHVNVNGLLAGRDVTSLVRDVIYLSQDTAVDSQLLFLSGVSVTNLHLVDGTLNGRPLVEYLGTVRLTNEDQVFTGHVTVTQVTAPSALVSGDLTVQHLIDGIDFSALLQQIILLNEEYNSSSTMWTLSALSVEHLYLSTLNGQLPGALLRVDSAAQLNQLTVAGQVHVQHVLNQTRLTTYNRLDLGVELGVRFQLSHAVNQTFLGEVTLAGEIVFNNSVSLGGLVNGVNISDLVVLGRTNSITSELVFSAEVSADQVIVEGLVGGANLSRCADSAIYPGQDTTLHGHYVFTQVEVNGSNADGVSQTVQSLGNTVNTTIQRCEQAIVDLNRNYTSQCDLISDVYEEIGSSYYALRYFDVAQELGWPDLGQIVATEVVQDVHGVSSVLVTYTRLSSRCHETRLLRWQPDAAGRPRLVDPARLVPAGAVRHWRHLPAAGPTATVVSAAGRPAAASCQQTLSAVWELNNGELRLVQDLGVTADQALYAEAPPGVPTLILVDEEHNTRWHYVYESETGRFVADSVTPRPYGAEVLFVSVLRGGALLELSAVGSTVQVFRVEEGRFDDAQLQQVLGSLTTTALYAYTLRNKQLFAVGDGGWSSLLNSPQGVKIFEYVDTGEHRCVPVQHLDAVSPAELVHFSLGSLPDTYLVVLELNCGLRIFIDKGEAGFGEFQRVTLGGATSVRLLVAAAAPPHLLVSAGRQLILLRPEMVGARVPPLTADCTPPDLQQ